MRIIDTANAAAIACLLLLNGCDSTQKAADITGGDPQNGKALIQQYGCTACHVVGGIAGAATHVGPNLTHIRERGYIAGVLDNTPANLQRWIMNPTEISPKTAMPDLGVTEEQARDIAAYLYTQ